VLNKGIGELVHYLTSFIMFRIIMYILRPIIHFRLSAVFSPRNNSIHLRSTVFPIKNLKKVNFKKDSENYVEYCYNFTEGV